MKSIDNPGGSSQHLRYGGLRCIRVLLGLLVVACAALLAIVVVGSVTGAWRLLPVRTGSMTPHAPQGSVVIVRPMPAAQLRIGQVIVFRAPVPGHPVVVHRVYELTAAPGGPVVRTKGDANAGPDPWQFRIRGPIVWRGGMVIPELGNAMFLLETLCLALGDAATITVPGGHNWLLVDPDRFGEVMTNVVEVARRSRWLEPVGPVRRVWRRVVRRRRR